MFGDHYIFIGGVPRSGTSLVQKILSLHSEIFAGPEFDHLPALMKTYTQFSKGLQNGRQSLFYNQEMIDDRFRTLLNAIFEDVLSKKGKSIFSEKTPDNILIFEQLQTLFPKAKFIIVVRDPRANRYSFQKVAEKARETGTQVHVGHNILRDVGLIEKSLTKANEFINNHPDKTLCIYYEALVKQPENQVRRLTDFLGVSFEDKMMDTEEKNLTSQMVASGNKTVAAWTSTSMYDQKITSGRIDAWKEGLSKSDIAYLNWYFTKNANPLLDSYSFSSLDILDRALLAQKWIKSRF